jgi:hypothetical protein
VELQVAIVEGKEAFVASQCNKSANRSTLNQVSGLCLDKATNGVYCIKRYTRIEQE